MVCYTYMAKGPVIKPDRTGNTHATVNMVPTKYMSRTGELTAMTAVMISTTLTITTQSRE